jgi:hypothetical protein
MPTLNAYSFSAAAKKRLTSLCQQAIDKVPENNSSRQLFECACQLLIKLG